MFSDLCKTNTMAAVVLTALAFPSLPVF